jgi:hypothetical protein
LQAGHAYQFRVRAVNKEGESGNYLLCPNLTLGVIKEIILGFSCKSTFSDSFEVPLV